MKNLSNIMLKVISLVCAISQFFVSFGISSFATSSDDTSNSDDVNIETSINELTNNTVYSLNDSTEVTSSELVYTITGSIDPTPCAIRITFDATDVSDYSFEKEGLTVVEKQTAPMVFDLIANDEFGRFEVEAEKTNGDIVNKIIYTYCNGTSIFVSDISKDEAWHQCKQIEFDNNLITIDEWHKQYSDLSLEFSNLDTSCSVEGVSEINETASDGNIVVTGRMTWETESGYVLPIRCAKVELRDWYLVTSGCIATTYTDSNGYYSFTFNPEGLTILPDLGLNLFVRTYTESNTFTVAPPFLEGFNYFDSHIIENVTSESGEINISRIIFKNSDYLPYRLLYVQQGMVVGQRFASEMGMETNERLYVFYPISYGLIPELEKNALCYDRISLIGHSKYNSFATTIHEYGHYVENRMGNYGNAVKGQLFECIPDNFNGLYEYLTDFINGVQQVMNDYTHTVYENHFEEDTSKDFQMELTWTESWATAFAEIAFHYYDSEYVGVSFDNFYDYEASWVYSDSGEAQEYAVTSFLWDMYDAYSSEETDDNVEMTYQQWWDITTKSGTYTLQDLTNNIINNYPALINDVGEILSNHQISPMAYTVTSYPCVEEQLKLRWKVNGSESHPNNIFRVAFYDNENNLIGLTGEISSILSYSSTFNYSVPKNLWISVMEQYEVGETIYAVIYGYRTGDFTSGPYFSERVTVWDDSKNHIFNSKGYDGTYHWDVCGCGVPGSAKSVHNLSYTDTDSSEGTHFESCDECGYYAYVYHKYTKVPDSYHTGICACGHVNTNLPHSEGYCVYKSSANHYIYCDCGELMGTSVHTIVTKGTRSYCTGCLHLFTSPGATNSVGCPVERIDE